MSTTEITTNQLPWATPDIVVYASAARSDFGSCAVGARIKYGQREDTFVATELRDPEPSDSVLVAEALILALQKIESSGPSALVMVSDRSLLRLIVGGSASDASVEPGLQTLVGTIRQLLVSRPVQLVPAFEPGLLDKELLAAAHAATGLPEYQ